MGILLLLSSCDKESQQEQLLSKWEIHMFNDGSDTLFCADDSMYSIRSSLQTWWDNPDLPEDIRGTFDSLEIVEKGLNAHTNFTSLFLHFLDDRRIEYIGYQGRKQVVIKGRWQVDDHNRLVVWKSTEGSKEIYGYWKVESDLLFLEEAQGESGGQGLIMIYKRANTAEQDLSPQN